MEESTKKLEEEVGRLVELAKEMEESASSFVAKTTTEEQSLRQRALSIDSAIKKLRSSIDSAIKKGTLDRNHAEKSWIWDGCLPALPVQLYQAWLLFLYTSLALRENILRVNGSDIRSWWIYHHYCAMAMAVVSLTWEIQGQPDCDHKQRGVQLFLLWAVMQGVATLLQNRYQRQRLYTRIALGKAKRMDVVWGETAGVEGQLWLLCPLLFILQGFEAYVGLLLLRTALVGVVSEWQVVFCGILLLVMAAGNFTNTVQTLMAKSRFKAKVKRSKSKQELSLGSTAKNS